MYIVKLKATIKNEMELIREWSKIKLFFLIIQKQTKRSGEV